MNTYVVLVAVVAVLAKRTSAGCIGGPVLFPAPVLSPIVPAPCISAPLLPAPIYPSTTIVKTNSVTESLVDVLQMLPVVNLLNNQLPLCPNVLAAPILPCGCGLGCGCGCGTIYI